MMTADAKAEQFITMNGAYVNSVQEKDRVHRLVDKYVTDPEARSLLYEILEV